jgi:hypothetical protein
MAKEFAAQRAVDVVERVPGSSPPISGGIAHVPSQTERNVLSSRRPGTAADVLACHGRTFDDVAANVSAELRPGQRPAGRTRDRIIRHVYLSEPDQMSRKVEVRTPLDVVAAARPGRTSTGVSRSPPGLQRRGQGGPELAPSVPIRRSAHHAMITPEMEDRDLTS